MEKSEIPYFIKDPVINLVLDTISKDKQALVFVNSKRSAESMARKISEFMQRKEKILLEKGISISNKDILYDLSKEVVKKTQTHQCLALSQCLREGIAFHHAGLTSDQKRLVEQNFKKSKIKIICCTPTLAIGMDLPAFRVIIRDLKRYTSTGMNFIPNLEYEQISGRAGRPGQETSGESIIILGKESQKDSIVDKFIFGDIEHIYSKLAVEPVFRIYLLSLISSEFVRTKKEIIDFFSKTFWSYQYKDPSCLQMMIENMLKLLEDFGFIEEKNIHIKINNNKNNSDEKNSLEIDSEFINASKITKDNINNSDTILYSATAMGKRVSELYLDPLSANLMIMGLHGITKLTSNEDNQIDTTSSFNISKINQNALKQSNIDFNSINKKEFTPFTFLHLLSSLLEIRPYLGVRAADTEILDEGLVFHENHLICDIPTQFDFEYDDFLAITKTALFVQDWIDEKDEEFLLKKFNIRPGEIHTKIQILDWLCYAMYEICILLGHKTLLKEISKIRVRISKGVKEELLPFLKLKQVGRVRARQLYKNNLKNMGDLKSIKFAELVKIVGQTVALSIKNQVGETVDPSEIANVKKESFLKNNINSNDFNEKKTSKNMSKKSKKLNKSQSSIFDFQ